MHAEIGMDAGKDEAGDERPQQSITTGISISRPKSA